MRSRLNRSIPLAQVADGRDNNFDVLRLGAALAVLVSHAFPLTGHGEPLARLGGPTLGGLGVAVFFGMSGFLVAKSWRWDPRVRSFLRKRALRILPALWVVTLVTVLMLGPVVSTESVAHYFSSAQPWTYLARCFVLVTFDGALPGVFTQNTYPDAVNGSLWTLPFEVAAYFALVVLGVAGVLARRHLALVVFAVVAAAGVAAHAGLLAEPLGLAAYFLAGTTLYLYRDSIRLSWPVAFALLAMWCAGFGHPAFLLATGVVALPYVVLVIAYRTPHVLARLCAAGDVSYGVYIYAFPTQQAVVHFAHTTTPLANVLIAAPITWILAYASWKFVESPALRFKPVGARRLVATRGDVLEPELTPA